MFPAGAGMNRRAPESGEAPEGVPRRRGDEPLLGIILIGQVECSPQARG